MGAVADAETRRHLAELALGRFGEVRLDDHRYTVDFLREAGLITRTSSWAATRSISRAGGARRGSPVGADRRRLSARFRVARGRRPCARIEGVSVLQRGPGQDAASRSTARPTRGRTRSSASALGRGRRRPRGTAKLRTNPKGRSPTLTSLEQARRIAAPRRRSWRRMSRSRPALRVTAYTDFFVLATAETRQTKAIYDEVRASG